MRKISTNFILLLLVAGFVMAPAIFIAAQQISTVNQSSASTYQTPEQKRQALEDELKQLEQQISQYENDITKTKQEKQTLQNKIYTLKREIDKLDLQISQGNIMIKDLGLQIKDTEKSVDTTTKQIDDYRERLADIVRTFYQESQKSLVEILLSEPDLASFSANLAGLERLNGENQRLLANIKDLKNYLQDQKVSLDQEKEDLQKTVVLQTLKKQQSLSTQKEQEGLLKQTQGKEDVYQQLLTSTRQRANEIRARIFELIGVVQAPTFEEAVKIANSVEALTGVRPAFLLAVMTQESNIGKNVGQCYLKDTSTGNGIRINGQPVSKVMKPSRDIPAFIQIVQELGRDIFNTPVSCPIVGVGGYGGAMGPAQFIPSTWMIYKNRLVGFKGGNPDPWNIKDAFLASAVYLSDAGATAQTYNKEWCAAIAYFSGNCSSANQKRYGFYANSVMAIASGYEDDIKTIGQY